VPVELTINTQTLAVPPGRTLFDCAEQAGVPVPTSCHKQGKCRECLMEVVEGATLLSPPAPEEQPLAPGFRLACRCCVTGETGAVRCHTLRRGRMQIEEHALAVPDRLPPASRDPAVTRDGDWVLLEEEPLVRAAGPLHGLALDIGTTTVAMRLVNLETGELVARAAFENPQRFGGSNVMARIHYDTHHPGRLLQRTLIAYLNHAIEEFPVDPRSIYEIVVAGNPTMRDLFFGLEVHSLGQKPFRSTTETDFRAGARVSTSVTAVAKELRLPAYPGARVYGLPLIGAHVGADAAASLLAVDLAHEERLVAVMDIGTNTELILGNRHRALAASCPAGPAFEGGGVACGMPALTGAIERVRLDDNGCVAAQVIGGGAPEGLCGSGLVDLLSELRRTGRMNPLGRFAPGNTPFVVDAPGRLLFRESDASELAQAKSANLSGLQILFKRYGVTFEAMQVFYLAGGFARHIDAEAARRIGLIPNIAAGRIVKAGNLAVQGATLALLSRSRRRELEQFVRGVEHVELETDPEFFDHFVLGCRFAPMDEAHVG
jgi:uncharacterized 2Fe-2S/4Fe-4S cluster protein (DUF4445 family)